MPFENTERSRRTSGQQCDVNLFSVGTQSSNAQTYSLTSSKSSTESEIPSPDAIGYKTKQRLENINDEFETDVKQFEENAEISRVNEDNPLKKTIARKTTDTTNCQLEGSHNDEVVGRQDDVRSNDEKGNNDELANIQHSSFTCEYSGAVCETVDSMHNCAATQSNHQPAHSSKNNNHHGNIKVNTKKNNENLGKTTEENVSFITFPVLTANLVFKLIIPEEPLPLNGEIKYIKYRYISRRKKTYFVNWPHNYNQLHSALSMALAGFFSTGEGDGVICFACGLGLNAWLSTDDPFTEHERWFQDCPYIQFLKLLIHKQFPGQLVQEPTENPGCLDLEQRSYSQNNACYIPQKQRYDSPRDTDANRLSTTLPSVDEAIEKTLFGK